MNASDLKFFTHDIRSTDPAVQLKAFEILFGKIDRSYDEDDNLIEKLESGSSYIKKPLYRIIPKVFNSYNFLDVYKIVSNMLFNHLITLDCSNVKNIRTWLWSVVENFVLKHEDEIKEELGAADKEFTDSISCSYANIDFGTAAPDTDEIVNRYLDELKNTANGEYSTRLIEQTVLKNVSLDDFCKEENDYREEYHMPAIQDSKAISRHKYNAILALIRISSADIKILRKHVYLKLQEEGLLEDNLQVLENYCLNDGEIHNNQLHLVKRMFDIYNKAIDESKDESLGYYKEYHWLYNKYNEACKDKARLSKLNKLEIKSLNLYFDKGIINNNIQFTNSLIKLGDCCSFIAGMPDKIKRFQNRHKEICSLKDSPEIIENYFIESYNKYQEQQLERKDNKLQEEIIERQENSDNQVWTLQF